MKSPLEVNVDQFFIDFQWPYDAQIIPRRFQVARRALLLDPNLFPPPGRAQRASERSERSERSDHDLYRALRFLAIFSSVSIASVSCTFLDIFRVLLFVILVRASRSDAKTGLLLEVHLDRRFPWFSLFRGSKKALKLALKMISKRSQIVENVEPNAPRTRQTAATDVLIF